MSNTINAININNSIKGFVGSIFAKSGDEVPFGFLECNGAELSRTVYSELFDVIGTTYGSGDGSSTFNLPDLRGEFIRGWDNGRGVDSGRNIGSFQSDEFKSHSHSWSAKGHYNGTVPGTGVTSSTISKTFTSNSTGGAETRPRNIAMMYCIKY